MLPGAVQRRFAGLLFICRRTVLRRIGFVFKDEQDGSIGQFLGISGARSRPDRIAQRVMFYATTRAV
jgi:hypothetical protein